MNDVQKLRYHTRKLLYHIERANWQHADYHWERIRPVRYAQVVDDMMKYVRRRFPPDKQVTP